MIPVVRRSAENVRKKMIENLRSDEKAMSNMLKQQPSMKSLRSQLLVLPKIVKEQKRVDKDNERLMNRILNPTPSKECSYDKLMKDYEQHEAIIKSHQVRTEMTMRNSPA